MTLIEARDLQKEFVNQTVRTLALKAINLAIDESDFLGIVGPSGSGKSTLLYVLSGLEKPTSGKVSFRGKAFEDHTEKAIQDLRKKEIGFVFQFYNLLPNLTVSENIELSLIINDNHDKERINTVLEWVGMSKFGNFYPNHLSGGMQQKVAIARAIANNPAVIFADEPTGNLDYHSGVEIMELLQRLHRDQQVAIVMVTHNPDNLKYCTRRIDLLDGTIVRDAHVSV